jgi:hypothetical protein
MSALLIWLRNFIAVGAFGLAALACVALLNARMQLARRDAQIATLKADWATQRAAMSDAALTVVEQRNQARSDQAVAVAQAHARAQKEIDDAKRKLETGRAAVRAGAVRVRLNGAECAPAAAGGDVPAAAPAPGVADAAAGPLPASVSERVLDLQHAIEYDARQIRGLQQYIRGACGDAMTLAPVFPLPGPLPQAGEGGNRPLPSGRGERRPCSNLPASAR